MARINGRQAPHVGGFYSMAMPYANVSVRHQIHAPHAPAEAQKQEPASVGSAVGRYLPVKKMAQVYSDVVSEGALRHLIWQAEAYEKDPKEGLKSNGFLSVIVRPPGQRKVLLDRVEFEKWLTSRQCGRA